MIPTTKVDGEILERIRGHAEKAWLNGKSHVRTSDRATKGMEDQLVGQLGEYALARYFGVEEQYFNRRLLIEEQPYLGDGGSDLPREQVDVKTSLMRGSQNPERYNLLVRPAERHDGNIYVLALVKSLVAPVHVLLVGWCTEADLPSKPAEKGIFEGAYRLPATKLRPMRRDLLV